MLFSDEFLENLDLKNHFYEKENLLYENYEIPNKYLLLKN